MSSSASADVSRNLKLLKIIRRVKTSRELSSITCLLLGHEDCASSVEIINEFTNKVIEIMDALTSDDEKDENNLVFTVHSVVQLLGTWLSNSKTLPRNLWLVDNMVNLIILGITARFIPPKAKNENFHSWLDNFGRHQLGNEIRALVVHCVARRFAEEFQFSPAVISVSRHHLGMHISDGCIMMGSCGVLRARDDGDDD